MIVDAEYSIGLIKKQIEACYPDCEGYGWLFSEVDESNLFFTVRMRAKDNETYLLKVFFDNYSYWPLLLDFIDEKTNEAGVRTAYPYCSDNFFNKVNITICHPCSRKAYKGYTGLHNDWGELEGWQKNPSIGLFKSLKPILEAISFRLNGDLYNGRMEKRQ
jgi:hypothetical protein